MNHTYHIIMLLKVAAIRKIEKIRGQLEMTTKNRRLYEEQLAAKQQKSVDLEAKLLQPECAAEGFARQKVRW